MRPSSISAEPPLFSRSNHQICPSPLFCQPADIDDSHRTNQPVFHLFTISSLFHSSKDPRENVRKSGSVKFRVFVLFRMIKYSVLFGKIADLKKSENYRLLAPGMGKLKFVEEGDTKYSLYKKSVIRYKIRIRLHYIYVPEKIDFLTIFLKL